MNKKHIQKKKSKSKNFKILVSPQNLKNLSVNLLLKNKCRILISSLNSIGEIWKQYNAKEVIMGILCSIRNLCL